MNRCCVCYKAISVDTCYICEACNREIDRRADETMGNQEEEDADV